MDNSGPAFPHLWETNQRVGESEMYPGLTKRELAAMFMLQGMLSSETSGDGMLLMRERGQTLADFKLANARDAIAWADALLAELAEAQP